MFEVKLDLQPFEDLTKHLDAAADQIPFALSRALNDSANDAYNFVIDQTWPKSVTVRSTGFLRWALRTKFSTKQDLSIEIYDNTPDQRAHLAMHAQGGTKTGKGGHMIAVPSRNVARGAQGVPQEQRPKNLANKVVKGNKIYQAIGKGKERALRLMFTLTRTARQPMDVPFNKDFEDVMREGVTKHFIPRMREAMKTRR